MARELYQVLLDAPGCSGRAVRYRVLPPNEHDAITLKAAMLGGKEGTMFELRMRETHEGVMAMLVQVSKETGMLTQDAMATATWVGVNVGVLEMPGPLQYSKDGDVGLFTSKDDAILTAIYKRAHEVTAAEIDSIVGKALPVSVG